jgi:uncharacterized protein (TIGR00369 family)
MNQPALAENQIARIRETFTRVPYAHFLGLELGEIRSGEALIHLKVRDEFKQNQGVVHGGVIASLIDTASAFAVTTELEPGERVTTTDLTIHYLRPVTEGDLQAKARIVRSGRRLFVISVEVSDSRQALIATAATGYIRLK